MFRFGDDNFFERFAKKYGIFKFKISKMINYIVKRWILFLPQYNVFPYEWFKKMDNMKIYGTTWKVPAGRMEYIKNTYGEDWETPDINYVGKKKKVNNKARRSYRIKDKNILRMWLDR